MMEKSARSFGEESNSSPSLKISVCMNKGFLPEQEGILTRCFGFLVGVLADRSILLIPD